MTISGLSVVIPAYNEESVISDKLLNAYSTTLSHDRFEVMIGSDGSTDRTVQRILEFKQRHAITNIFAWVYPNEGKAQTLNKLVSAAHHNLILATDADSVFELTDLFEFLVQRFDEEPQLGAVSCVPVFETNGIENGYWKTEKAIRTFLERRRSLFVLTGMGCAFRKTLFNPIPQGVMADDLWIPLSILRRGHHVAVEKRFTARTAIFSDEREITRKIRVIKGGMHCFWRFFTAYPEMIPTRVFFWFFVFKVLRWALPLYIVAALIVAYQAGAVVFGLTGGIILLGVIFDRRVR